MTVPMIPTSLYQVSRDGRHGFKRSATVIDAPGGISVVQAIPLAPVGTHPIHLECQSLAQIEQALTWFEGLRGSWRPFWLPSFQRDFVPLEDIACDATAFTILERGYTDAEFPTPNRRAIAFVFGDNDITRRTITGSVNNGDGTETITFSEQLYRIFQQRRHTGISFCWYGRLASDTLRVQWQRDQAVIDAQMIELLDPPSEGGGDAWTHVIDNADGGASVSEDETEVIVTSGFLGGFAEFGFSYMQRIITGPPGIAIDITGNYQIDAAAGFADGIRILSDAHPTPIEVFFPVDHPIDTPIPFAEAVIFGSDGIITLQIGRFDLQSLEPSKTVTVTDLDFGGDCL